MLVVIILLIVDICKKKKDEGMEGFKEIADHSDLEQVGIGIGIFLACVVGIAVFAVIVITIGEFCCGWDR
jgi:hypothetical protein